MKLLYYLYNLSKVKLLLFTFINKTSIELKVGKTRVIIWMLADLFRYNTFIYDYFYYRFFDKAEVEKKKYCDTLLMYRFHKKCNSKAHVNIFSNKIIFPQYFKNFISHQHFVLEEDNYSLFLTWLQGNSFNKFVIKHPTGQAGTGVIVCKLDKQSDEYLINGQSLKEFYLEKLANGYTLVEEFIEQHSVMQAINPGSVNTLRIITYLLNGEVQIIATMIRIGLNKSVDNFDAGGISAIVNPNTGIIEGPGVTKDPFNCIEYYNHPVTGSSIKGVQIPFWNEILSLIKKAALVVPDVKTVGWDVVITDVGPSLIEGNQNWDKTHWELTYNKGFRNIIENHLSLLDA